MSSGEDSNKADNDEEEVKVKDDITFKSLVSFYLL